MRLFTGIALPRDVIANLERLLDRLRPAAQIKWSAAYNLHITTKFIGEWPEQRVPELVETLRPLSAAAPIDVSIGGMGWFPNPHSPRVLWLGIQASESLGALARATDEALAAIGVPKEDRKFSPHLTLGRIKDPVPLVTLRKAIAEMPPVEFGSFVADRFHLYRSVPGPAGSIYTQLAEFALNGS
ncbi:MAG: RNA 2',3'-cyclic phosphodiesterase [Acidobacteria bacterium]|nr:RNA 2',3'-cyclic phosphodiesterase [Acidobacteriota bacterium]